MTDGPISCGCLDGDFTASAMERTFLGTDDRGAEISVEQCTRCGGNWLVYHLEAQPPSRPERWYRGRIGPDVAFSHRNAASIFGQLRHYWAGGSHFGGKVQLRSGPLDVS